MYLKTNYSSRHRLICTVQCEAGEYVIANGNRTSNRRCSNCADGFTSAANQQSCTPFETCQAGERILSSGNSTTDRDCGTCQDGFTNTVNQQSCTPFKTCQAGEVILVPGSSSSDRQCESCGTGTTTYSVNQYTCVLSESTTTSSNLRRSTSAPIAEELSTGAMSANLDGALVALVCLLHLIAKLF